jgi:hypothetical protein
MVRRTGRTHYSMKGIFERVRWHHDIETNTREPFKLNNNYTARYVRLIEKEYPNLVGFFRTRELTSD